MTLNPPLGQSVLERLVPETKKQTVAGPMEY